MRIPPVGNHRLGAKPFSCILDVAGAVLAVSQHRPEPDSYSVNPLEERLEVQLVVLVAWSHGVGDGLLGLGAAGGVDAVSEDEASPASADTGVAVASTRLIVHGSSTVGFEVCAVYCDYFAGDGS